MVVRVVLEISIRQLAEIRAGFRVVIRRRVRSELSFAGVDVENVLTSWFKRVARRDCVCEHRDKGNIICLSYVLRGEITKIRVIALVACNVSA